MESVDALPFSISDPLRGVLEYYRGGHLSMPVAWCEICDLRMCEYLHRWYDYVELNSYTQYDRIISYMWFDHVFTQKNPKHSLSNPKLDGCIESIACLLTSFHLTVTFAQEIIAENFHPSARLTFSNDSEELVTGCHVMWIYFLDFFRVPFGT